MMTAPQRKSCVLTLLLLGLGPVASCDNKGGDDTAENGSSQLPLPCSDDNGGLQLPAGFCAGVVADSLGFIRHLAVNGNGDIYVTLRNSRLNLGGMIGLRDTDQDGRMDRIEKFSDIPGMGIAVRSGFLYFASDTDIYRYPLKPPALVPDGLPQVLVRDLPVQTLHAAKPFALSADDHLYVNIGATTNACQQIELAPETPGRDPCPELQQHAGVWRFSLNVENQTQTDGQHYASEIRNAYALDWHPVFRNLYVVQHGRDQLHELWPQIYTAADSDRLPAEEFILIREGGRYGWPYCYYDPVQNKRILAPEYGGDGKTTGRCEEYPPPLVAFPAHYGPNDLKFYSARQFPDHYHNGAFIAFHGAGYQVAFVPFREGIPAGDWETFASGFAGQGNITLPEDADYRPTGLAVGPDGSLYIADSVQGRIWRVLYAGSIGK